MPFPENIYHQQSPLSETSFSPGVEQYISILKPQASSLLGLVTKGQTHVSTDNTQAIESVMHETYGVTGSIPPLADGQETKRVIGRGDFSWRRNLSENGQELWKWLIVEMGDRDFLSIHASEDKWDLASALIELRNHGMLDESDPQMVRIIRR